MLMSKILIKYGLVISPTGESYSDILIDGEKISRIGPRDTIAPDGDTTVLDAAGKWILPGLVEPHMHIKAPLGGYTDILDFDSAGKCAAFGGVTTFMDFSSTLPGISLKQAVKERLDEMAAKSKLDYSVHCKVVNLVSKESLAALMQAEVDLDHAIAGNGDKEKAEETLENAKKDVNKQIHDRLQEIPKIIQDGIPTFKLFMTYRKANVMIDDIYMLQVLETVRDAGGRCGFHAECNAIAEYNEELFARKGTLKWEDFPRCKPNICEEEAVRRVLYYAELLHAPIYFFHISTKGAVEAIRQAKARGVDVIAETCSHYLMLTDEMNKGEDGILYLMSPPLRSKEDQDALWEGLIDGTLSLVTSDNCSFPRWMKEDGLTTDTKGKYIQDFTKVISGVSGIEERLGLLLSKVGKQKGFTRQKLVEVACANPARVFGCYPQKGCIAEGSDADITIVDPADKDYFLTLDQLHYPRSLDPKNKDNTLEYAVYGACPAGGRVTHTIRRGEFLVKNGQYQGENGTSEVSSGRLIHRTLHKEN